MDKIVGTINKIMYYNEENGYAIVKLKLDYKKEINLKFQNILFNNVVSVLSNFDRKPFDDEEYEFEGELEKSKYGYQFRASSFSRINIVSQEGIITYLSSDIFPGVGVSAATKIYKALGDDALNKIINDRFVLENINITEKQKNTVYENLVLNYKKEKDLISILNFGIGLKMAVRIVNTLGDNALKNIKENPYQLIDKVEGIAFTRADEIAKKVGIRKDDSLRLKSLIYYILSTNIYASGNIYYSFDELREIFHQVIELDNIIVDSDKFKDLLQDLVNDKKIVLEEGNVYDYHLYFDEISLAKSIIQFLNNTKLDYNINKLDYAIKEAMNSNSIEYSDKQIEAIKTSLKQPITIITGGPGTGKSTVIKGIVDAYCSLFKNQELIRQEVYLLAPTGRASKRLKEVTLHHNAFTMHKFLGYQGNGYFAALNEPITNTKLIIIDEFSMVDLSLATILFKCINPNTKIVIVGDVDQLPAVGPGDVLRDLIESKEIPTIKLDKIHRQASDSTIIKLAHEINEGYLPYSIVEKQNDRNFIACEDERINEIIKQVVQQGIDSGMNLIKDIQVLVPMYKGTNGIDAINLKLQDAFNPNHNEIVYNGKRFREYDKVIQLVNRQEKKVMNGDIGYIIYMNKKDGRIDSIDVMYDFGSVHYEKDELDDISLAYAISIHKAQGSEFKLVIAPFSFKYYIMLKRKLIYTAITRAKNYLIMIGNIDALKKGITEIEDKRKTTLKKRITEILLDPNKIYDSNSAFNKIEENDNSLSISDFMDNEIIDLSEMENITPYDFIPKRK